MGEREEEEVVRNGPEVRARAARSSAGGVVGGCLGGFRVDSRVKTKIEPAEDCCSAQAQ